MANAPIGGVETLQDASPLLVGTRKLNFQDPLAAAIDGGDPTQINVGIGAGGVPVTTIFAQESVPAVTALDTYQPVPGMSITPGAGTYFVAFSTSASVDKNGKLGLFAIFVNGVIVAESIRETGGQANNHSGIHTMAFNAVVGAGQAIEVRWRVETISGGPVMECEARQMVLLPSV